MPNLKFDILNKNELNQIEADYGYLINDSQLNTQIVLCKKTDGDYDPTTGIMGDTWVRKGVNALLGNWSMQEIAMGIGMFQLREAADTLATFPLGDVVFLIREKDFIEDLQADIETDDSIFQVVYSDGSASLTNNSTALTGVGTQWVSNIGKGNWFRITFEDTWYEIATVPSNTSATLVSAYQGATKTVKPYEVYKEYNVVRSEQDPTKTLRRIHCRRIS